jgi:hypothetical protein
MWGPCGAGPPPSVSHDTRRPSEKNRHDDIEDPTRRKDRLRRFVLRRVAASKSRRTFGVRELRPASLLGGEIVLGGQGHEPIGSKDQQDNARRITPATPPPARRARANSLEGQALLDDAPLELHGEDASAVRLPWNLLMKALSTCRSRIAPSVSSSNWGADHRRR